MFPSKHSMVICTYISTIIEIETSSASLKVVLEEKRQMSRMLKEQFQKVQTRGKQYADKHWV